MTTLSLVLYLADILNALNEFFVIGGILCLMLVPLFVFMGQDEFGIEHPGKICKWVIPIGAIMILLACVIPSKKTMYMIAGVELANSVVQSDDFNKVKNYLGETGIEMIDDIKSIIRAEAKEALEKTKNEK